MNNTTIKGDEFEKTLLERAKTRDTSGKVVGEVHLSNLMLTTHFEDSNGLVWDVDKPAPMSGGQNKVLYIFMDDEEVRVYCVPTKEHPGAFSRYVVPRVRIDDDKKKKRELALQKTGNVELFAAFIAIELRDLDAITPAPKWQDEVRQLQLAKLAEGN